MQYTIENYMSPVHPEGHTFIYFAEYDDGRYFYEYDNQTNHYKFDDMEKEKVVKFGLIGNKLKLYFDLNSGLFCINQSTKVKINLSFTDSNEIFDLSNESTGKKSLITFKDAHTDAIFTGNKATANSGNIIDAFNVGMKFKLPDEVFVTLLFVIPINGEDRGTPYFSLRFSSKINKECNINLEQILNDNRAIKLLTEAVKIMDNKSKSVKIYFSKNK